MIEIKLYAEGHTNLYGRIYIFGNIIQKFSKIIYSLKKMIGCSSANRTLANRLKALTLIPSTEKVLCSVTLLYTQNLGFGGRGTKSSCIKQQLYTEPGYLIPHVNCKYNKSEKS